MSIIGTRPPLISETNLYELHHRARLAIKPGITGMWQVSGRSDITDFEEVVRLDKEYITNWDIGEDGPSKRPQKHNEYSCAMKSHFRKIGNQSSGTRKSPLLCLMTYPFLLGYWSRPCRICGA